MTSTALTPSIAPPATVVAVVRDAAEWDRLAPEWSDLFDATPQASPPMRFDWLRRWWDVYGDEYGHGGTGLRILTVRHEGRLVGALPLYQSDHGAAPVTIRRLAMLSSGEKEFEETCADYLGLLYRPDSLQYCLEALRRALVDQELVAWDELVLDRMPADSPLLGWSSAFPDAFEAEQTPLGSCPVSDLTGGLEGYLRRLSAATRKECRRLINEADRAGLVVQCASDLPTTERYFEEMIELHQRRWQGAGKPGCFASRRFTEFHRGLSQQSVPEGKAALIRMSIGERTVSVVYGFMAGGKFDSYIQGTALDEPALRSAGTAALLMARKVAAELGCTLYDDLLGSAGAYKHRFGTSHVQLVRLRISRRGIRSSLHRASEVMVQAARRGWRMLAGGAHAPSGMDRAQCPEGHP